MSDREKVIEELMQLHGSKETMDIVSNAIALLKEQEPEKVFHMKERSIINETHGKTGFCPRCNQVVIWEINRCYCGFCGKGLIWG